MSKTAIIKSGEKYFMSQLSKSQAIVLDKVIFANISGVTGNTEVNLLGSMPSSSQIVYSTAVTQAGLLNDNTVVYSVILDTSIGDFTFNYIGLVNSDTNTLCMVMHIDPTKKIKTSGQQQGNTITESIWLEMDNASTSTGINVLVETWQIDFSSRLAGEDERIRQTNLDLYGRLSIKSGLEINKNGANCTISSGLAYVAGLQVSHSAEKSIAVSSGQSIYIDAWLAGSVTGVWTVNYSIVTGVNLKDYQSGNFLHYVEKIASVDSAGKLIKVSGQNVLKTIDLSSSIDSDSEVTAATSKAVKVLNDKAIKTQEKADSAYSLADSANTKASAALSRNTGGIVTGDTNFTKKLQQNGSDVITKDNIHDFIQLPAGTPLPCSSITPPSGWLKCNGATFDKARYPKLAIAYSSGKLPDLRGEFIRGLDDGRGVDASRTILSSQSDAIRNITGDFINTRGIEYSLSSSSGAFNVEKYPGGANGHGLGDNAGIKLVFDASRVVPTASENRPRNIAFLYIVKAE